MDKPKRSYGIGCVFKREGKPEEWDNSDGKWHIQYYHRNKRHRETTGTTSRAQAYRLLKKRLGEISTGKFIGPRE